MNFKVKFTREFDVDIQADDIGLAEKLAHGVVAQFPEGTCKLLSIYAENYVAPPPEEVAPVVSLTAEAKAALIRQEMKRPRFPGGIDDLWPVA